LEINGRITGFSAQKENAMISFEKNAGFSRVERNSDQSYISNPYDAWRLNPTLPLEEDEIRLDLISLNLDSTSARQIWEKNEGNEAQSIEEIIRIVCQRGKMHNPVTNSGGVLTGTISEVGRNREGEVSIGTTVVTLVSNTLVPISISRVIEANRLTHQVKVEGFAILPPFAVYSVVPENISLSIALSVLDVCGVVPQVERYSEPGSTVVVLGAAGRAGLLATYAASRAVGKKGQVIAVFDLDENRNLFQDAPENIEVLVADARNTILLEKQIRALSSEKYADLVVDCTNVSGVEIGATACCKNGGIVYFFNMSTRFQAVALGAELVNRDIQLMIGYGLQPSAERRAFQLLEENPALKRVF
jgi:L-erythro-3,5-diaminohexanoate dehydrogenase